MIELPRRRILTGLASLIAAPAIVRASSLMPVRALSVHPGAWMSTNLWAYPYGRSPGMDAVDQIAKLLTAQNELFDDMAWIEGPAHARYRIRTTLPAEAYRALP